MRSLSPLRVVAAVLAATLALTVAGPAAARQFDINANGSNVPAATQPQAPASPGPCSEVCSGHGYGTGTHASIAHRVVSAGSSAHASSGGFAWLYLALGGGAVAITVALGLSARRGRRRTRPAAAQSTLAA